MDSDNSAAIQIGNLAAKILKDNSKTHPIVLACACLEAYASIVDTTPEGDTESMDSLMGGLSFLLSERLAISIHRMDREQGEAVH